MENGTTVAVFNLQYAQCTHLQFAFGLFGSSHNLPIRCNFNRFSFGLYQRTYMCIILAGDFFSFLYLFFFFFSFCSLSILSYIFVVDKQIFGKSQRDIAVFVLCPFTRIRQATYNNKIDEWMRWTKEKIVEGVKLEF